MSYTPYNAPLLAGLLGDHSAAAFFSVKAEIEAMVTFEVELAGAQAIVGLIPEKSAEAIAARLAGFEANIPALGKATTRDGVVVPELVRQMKEAVGKNHNDHLHFGATSQDVTDSSAMVRLCDCIAMLTGRLNGICQKLEAIRTENGDMSLMARTRMQQALPITLADKVDNWHRPLESLLDECPKRFPLQLGGPNGRLDKMGEAAQTVAVVMADKLDLICPARHWQTDRQPMVDIANWFSFVTGALGKLGQDVVLMAQNEVGEVSLSGGGTSSAMPHKNNPVLAESLITLARFNATQVSGMHHALVHENERSGSAWALEWMIMPQMAVATGAALRNASELLEQATFNSWSA